MPRIVASLSFDTGASEAATFYCGVPEQRGDEIDRYWAVLTDEGEGGMVKCDIAAIHAAADGE